MTSLLAPELDRALRALPQTCRLCGALYPPPPKRSAASAWDRSSPATIPTGPSPTPRRSPLVRRPCGAIASGCRSRASRRCPWTAASPRWSSRRGWPARLGVARLWLKNDAVCHPSLSFKDRVVASALERRPGARPRHGGLRLHRQPGQRGRGPGGAGRASRLDLHPPRSRAGEGGRHRGLRPAAGPGARHLRRREPALRPGGRPLRLGPRQHQPARVLRRGLQDGRLRDLRAAWLARADGGRGADGRRLAGDEARQGLRRVRSAPGWYRARRPGSSAPRPKDARPSCGWWSRAATGSSRWCRPRSRARSRSAIRPTGVSPPRRSAAPAAGWRGCRDPEIVAGIRLLAETSGIFTETAGGATVAGALALARAGRLRPDDEVVLCITGNGLKTVEALQGALPESPVIAPRLRELEALYGRDL